MTAPNANFINNEWNSNGTEQSLVVCDKYSNVVLAELPLASAHQMEQAIAGAGEAFTVMKTWSAGKRSKHLAKLRDLLAEQRTTIIELIVAEAGKPIGYATAEFDRCLVTLDTAVREALTFTGEVVPMDYNNGEGKTAFTQRFPVGPIAAISPFNFPLNLALHKVAPAFAVGCSVLLKPSPYTPLVALKFAELVKAAGYPTGALNVLVCENEVAQNMVTDARLKMLSFTGSPGVGWHLKTLAGQKKVALELGGNAAVIIDENVDLQQAAKTTALGAFLYAGQICISTQRIFVHQSVFEDFKSCLIEATQQLHTGSPTDDCVINGPLIDTIHLNRIDEWVQEAIAQGATLLCGGQVIDAEHNLYAPTLLSNTQNSMKVSCEEVFGPVAIVESVESFQVAIDRVNDSEFGLQAGVFTNRIDHLKMAHQQLEVGGVMINNVPGFRIDNMPYGGVKSSGLGREGVRYAMEEMTEPRLLVY